ncbi:DUF1566 domain-containing protein [bacterium]|nr:DUF1566 domain-containing protein [bacterium]
MKKFNLIFILVLSAFFVFSCSSKDNDEELADTAWNGSSQGDDSGDSLPDAAANDGDKTDTSSDNNDSDTSDSDTSDTAITDNDITENTDDPDTTPEQSDDTDPAEEPDEPADDSNTTSEQPDDTDPTDDSQSDEDTADSTDDSDTVITDTDDSGDSEPDDDGDTSTPETPALPECSKDSGTPCILGDLIWSSSSSNYMKWSEAENHCKNLKEGGFNKDWRIPTISELRTLIQNCSRTATNGTCNVTDECLAAYSTANPKCYDINVCTSSTNASNEKCKYDSNKKGQYSKFGEDSSLWSSSEQKEDNNKVWFIKFKEAEIESQKKTLTGMVRCVHEIK